MQYRFASVEYVDPERSSRAISIVMSGALVAAWLGPELAVRTADLLPARSTRARSSPPSLVYLPRRSCSRACRIRLPRTEIEPAPPRRLAEIAAQPAFRVAVLAALCRTR